MNIREKIFEILMGLDVIDSPGKRSGHLNPEMQEIVRKAEMWDKCVTDMYPTASIGAITEYLNAVDAHIGQLAANEAIIERLREELTISYCIMKHNKELGGDR